MSEKDGYNLKIPTEKQIKEMRVYANKVVRRMIKRRERERRTSILM